MPANKEQLQKAIQKISDVRGALAGNLFLKVSVYVDELVVLIIESGAAGPESSLIESDTLSALAPSLKLNDMVFVIRQFEIYILSYADDPTEDDWKEAIARFDLFSPRLEAILQAQMEEK
jgi:hypothetical protein